MSGPVRAFVALLQRLRGWALAFSGALALVALILANVGVIKASIQDWFGAKPRDVEIVIDMFTEQPGSPTSWFTQYWVDYVGRTEADVLRIGYRSDYFEGVYGEDPVEHVSLHGEGPHFALPRIGLDFKVINQGDSPVFLHKVVLKVRQSIPDQRPILLLTQDDGIVAGIDITNDGWYEPQSLVLSAWLVSNEPDDATPRFDLDPISVGDNRFVFSIVPLLKAAGVDIELLGNLLSVVDSDDYSILPADQRDMGFESPSTGANASQRCTEDRNALYSLIPALCEPIRRFEPRRATLSETENNASTETNYHRPTEADFKSNPYLYVIYQGCDVAVDGVLRFEWKDAAGHSHIQALRISTKVLVTPPEGRGGTGFLPTGDYDVKLNPSGDDYEIIVPVSQPVGPREVDRFVLWVGANRSSWHDMEVSLHYNEIGMLQSRRVELDYFMPRSNSARLHRTRDQ